MVSTLPVKNDSVDSNSFIANYLAEIVTYNNVV